MVRQDCEESLVLSNGFLERASVYDIATEINITERGRVAFDVALLLVDGFYIEFYVHRFGFHASPCSEVKVSTHLQFIMFIAGADLSPGPSISSGVPSGLGTRNFSFKSTVSP